MGVTPGWPTSQDRGREATGVRASADRASGCGVGAGHCRRSGRRRAFTLFTWQTCSKLNASRKEKIFNNGISGNGVSILCGRSPHPVSFLLYGML